MELNYKVVDDSILISKDEIIRMIEESHKCAFEHFNDYALTKKPESAAASLEYEGCAHTWEYILSKLEKMMTLDEAIEHCKEKSCSNTKCAREHRQLEEWLKELKEYKKRYGDLNQE